MRQIKFTYGKPSPSCNLLTLVRVMRVMSKFDEVVVKLLNVWPRSDFYGTSQVLLRVRAAVFSLRHCSFRFVAL